MENSEIITDSYVASVVLKCDGRRKTPHEIEMLYEEIPQLKEYIKNRYTDSESDKETIKRILNHIDIRPVCMNCGKIMEFNDKVKTGFRMYCSSKCQNSDPNKILRDKASKLEKYGSENYNNMEKNRATCLEKYGVSHYLMTKECKERIAKTCMERYGVEHSMQSENVKNKSRETKLKKYGDANFNNRDKAAKTCMMKYGVENYTQTEEYLEKERNTCMERYGVSSYRKTDECEQKIRNTNLQKYGADHVTRSEEWKNKWFSNKEWVANRTEHLFNTMKENGSFVVSNGEKILNEFLLENYKNVVSQYKDERYPYKCDFYLKDYDIFIEYNGHWTHGNKFFDENDENDINKLNYWKQKGTKFYDAAINTWTVLDINKLKTAKENKINYVVLWYGDIFDLECVKNKIDSVINKETIMIC